MELLSNVTGWLRESQLLGAGKALQKAKELEEDMDDIEQGKKLRSVNPDDIDDDVLLR